jgi:hypothetical protein
VEGTDARYGEGEQMGQAESGGNHKSEGSGATRVRAVTRVRGYVVRVRDESKRLCRERGYEVMRGTMRVRSGLGVSSKKLTLPLESG